jgi:hypothetical protein
MEYPGISTLIVFFCMAAIVVLLVTGCTNAYEDCLEQQKAEYRARNPQASVAAVLNQQRNFEVMCSKFKR